MTPNTKMWYTAYHKILNVWFQKVSPLNRRSMEIPSVGGGGVLKAKVLEGKNEAKLRFPGEWGGAKRKNSR